MWSVFSSSMQSFNWIDFLCVSWIFMMLISFGMSNCAQSCTVVHRFLMFCILMSPHSVAVAFCLLLLLGCSCLEYCHQE